MKRKATEQCGGNEALKRSRRLCSHEGCTKSAVGKTGKCKAHGGGKRCSESHCTKSAQGKTDKCKAHGGGKRCSEPECTNSAEGKTDKCVSHGGGKRCSEPGCTKSSQGKTDKCKAHGGGKRCSEPGCTTSAVGNTDKCAAHGGGKRCSESDCTTSAQGKTDKCITHGGGKRCSEPGCTTSARSRKGKCAAHGGGKRCSEPGCTTSARDKKGKCKAHGGGKRCSEPGCTTTAQGKTDKCITHGGGKRCSEPDCTTSAQGKTDKCITHGGGKRCSEPDCTKSAVGKTDNCAAHGGGPRCEDCCVSLQEPSLAKYFHPTTKIGLCTAAARNMVMAALNKGDDEMTVKLKRHFGFKKDLLLRAEHVFYHELVKRVPGLSETRRVLDETILAKLVGKQKSMEDPRPDYFHFDKTTNIALHGEFDETPEHEDDDRRLDTIAHHAGCGKERVYIFRIQGHIGTDQALCRRVVRRDVAFYQITDQGYRVVNQVAEYVTECLEYMKQGLTPNDSEGRIRKQHF